MGRFERCFLAVGSLLVGSSRRGAHAVHAWVLVALLLAPAAALSASFQQAGSMGFQVGFVSDSEIEALPDLRIDAVSVPDFLSAGVDPGSAVVLSQSVCILPDGGDTCQTSAVQGPLSAIITWEITAIDSAVIQAPLTLLINGLVSPLEPSMPQTGYLSSEVEIVVNAIAPAGLDTNATPGVMLDPSSPSGFDPFVLIRDETFGTGSAADLFLGWTIVGVGDAITFRYELSALRENDDMLPYLPQFRIAAIPVVVPEPGTALLMGLGLTALALSRRGPD